MIPSSLGRYTRRDFLRTSALAVTGLDLAARPAWAEPPPEVRTLKLSKEPYACLAPEYVVDEFLTAEGFSGVQRVEVGDSSGSKLVAKGELDFELEAAATAVTLIDAGEPLVTLAGLHGGCYELFGTERVRSVRDLKGKTVAILAPGAGEQVLLSAMAAYVGLDPRRDIKWESHPFEESARLLAEGKVDAYMAFPPEPQELRAKRIGRVIVNTTTAPAVVGAVLLYGGREPGVRSEASGSHEALPAGDSSRRPTSAPVSPIGSPATSSTRATRRISSTPTIPSGMSHTRSGGPTIPRRRSASTRFGSATSA